MTKNMAKRLENKVCIITGSANGIGFATAQKFCDEGGISIICDMNDAQVKAAVDQLKAAGGQAEGFVMNVTNRKNIDEVVAAVMERHGRIDVLISSKKLWRSYIYNFVSFYSYGSYERGRPCSVVKGSILNYHIYFRSLRTGEE